MARLLAGFTHHDVGFFYTVLPMYVGIAVVIVAVPWGRIDRWFETKSREREEKIWQKRYGVGVRQ